MWKGVVILILVVRYKSISRVFEYLGLLFVIRCQVEFRPVRVLGSGASSFELQSSRL